MTKRTRDDAPPRAASKRTKAAAVASATSAPPEFSCESVRAAARSSLHDLLRGKALDADAVLADARVVYLTSDEASWVYHVPGWYSRLYESLAPHAELRYADWFAALWELHPPHHDAIKLFGKDVLMPRFQQVYGQSYRFSGKLFEAEPFPHLLHHALHAMQRLVVHPASGETYVRAGLVNWYAHGDHYMGAHSDDESSIHARSPVFSLSLGATRRFVFTTRATAKSATHDADIVAREELELRDGDLLIMGGTTQQTHKHALPKMKRCQDKRISITLRCFK